MKRMVFGLALSLTALGFLASPAFAAGPQQGVRAPSVADRAFLASLAAQAPKAPAAVPAAAKQPAIGEKALCGATANCGGGVTVSCSGNNSVTSCSAYDRNCAAGERGHVTCDGATTWCPDPCPGCVATALCGNGTTVSCSGTNNCTAADKNCSVGEQGHATCDGTTVRCSNLCDCGPDWCTGEQSCADSCFPCSYTYTCNATTCGETCRCNFRTCPV